MSIKNFNLQSLVRPSISTLQPYSSARDEFTNFDSDMVFLDANENPFETEVNRYPDPQQMDVRSLLAAQKGLSPSQILLGNGSDEVLDLLFRAFCEPNKDNVIILPPTYGMYKVLADINAVATKEILLLNNFEPNVEGILTSQDEMTKLLFLCSPNNPTANSFDKDKVEVLIRSFQGIVVIDEAYIDFSEDETWLAKLGAHSNLVITQTLSKAYGMAGIRLGICYGSPEIIAVLNKIKPPYNVNELTQQSAFERLVNIDKVSEELDLILSEKERLFKVLLQVNFIQEVYPSQTNFLLIKVDNAIRRYQQLLEAGIVVRNRSNLPLCEETLRITVGTDEENTTLIETLKKLA